MELPTDLILNIIDNTVSLRLLNHYFKNLITTNLLSEHIQKFGHDRQRFLLFTEAIEKYNFNRLYKHDSDVVRLMAYKISISYNCKIDSRFKYFQFIYDYFVNDRKCKDCENKTLFPNEYCFVHLIRNDMPSLTFKDHKPCNLTSNLYLWISYKVNDDMYNSVYKLEFSIDAKIINIVGPDCVETRKIIEDLRRL